MYIRMCLQLHIIHNDSHVTVLCCISECRHVSLYCVLFSCPSQILCVCVSVCVCVCFLLPNSQFVNLQTHHASLLVPFWAVIAIE